MEFIPRLNKQQSEKISDTDAGCLSTWEEYLPVAFHPTGGVAWVCDENGSLLEVERDTGQTSELWSSAIGPLPVEELQI